MKRYEILAIDVWGNARDGYEINDQHRTGVYFEVPDNADDATTLKALRKALGHRADARGYYDPIQSESELCFHRKQSGKPAYYATLVETY